MLFIIFMFIITDVKIIILKPLMIYLIFKIIDIIIMVYYQLMVIIKVETRLNFMKFLINAIKKK